MASETSSRLVKCFEAVFPGASEAEILGAKQATLAGWDSTASVTLYALIEEEFRIQLDTEILERFTSFQEILRTLDSQPYKQ